MFSSEIHSATLIIPIMEEVHNFVLENAYLSRIRDYPFSTSAKYFEKLILCLSGGKKCYFFGKILRTKWIIHNWVVIATIANKLRFLETLSLFASFMKYQQCPVF